MDVVDVYCGIGGFSAGAIGVGCKSILGIDCDDTVLSPPCTLLSHARRGAAGDIEDGLVNIRAALDFVLERRDASWSLENVSTPHTRALLQGYAAAAPDLVAYTTIDAADIATPSSRLRLIAGPPALIRRLRQTPVFRISVAEAFESAGVELPGAMPMARR